MTSRYDNDFTPHNVYGRALTLLRHHCVSTASVHLDVGCGYGHIAEKIRDDLSRTYVGVDADADGLASLSRRGFETHRVHLGEYETTLATLRMALGGRTLGSITMLDTIEHLLDPLATLRALRDLAAEAHAPVVLSVPNVAHRDLGLKLLMGRFDYTEAGLLDATHLGFYTERRFLALTRAAGLDRTGSDNVRMEWSDQHFPSMHVALADGSTLRAFLGGLRDEADANATVVQFVFAFAAGQAKPYQQDWGKTATASAERPPFLSIVMRTQGNRIHALADAFCCLMGQSRQDFEVLVMGHRLDVQRQLAVERAIAENPTWLRERIRLVLVERPGRTAPLNDGFAEARGDYVSVFDDDDMVLGHWVEVFQTLAAEKPGAILRAGCVRQWNQVIPRALGAPGEETVRATSGFDRPWATEFDWVSHLHMNSSPGLSLAFPRSIFADFGHRFDEAMSTNEDWDFLIRAVPLCGIANTAEVTSIYRWWGNHESSMQIHHPSEWEANRLWAQNKLDKQPYLIPPGGARRIRELFEENMRLREVCGRSHEEGTPAADAVMLRSLMESRSWKITKPLRLLAQIAGRPGGPDPVPERLTAAELPDAIAAVRASTSWRVTAPLRQITRWKRGER